MTIHGSPFLTIQNEISRTKERLKQRRRYARVIRNPEAYAKAIEDNKRFQLQLQHALNDSKERKYIRARMAIQKPKPVTLPKIKF